MTDTDPDAFQAAIDRWLAARSPTTTALAADGKRLRGANRQCDAEYQTVSLVSHHDKQPISSRIFTDTGGEIAAVFALLEDADISGSVITLDALHTTRDTATAILHRHHAHYLLSVKGNASETYAALDTIDWGSGRHGELLRATHQGPWPHRAAPHPDHEIRARHAQLPAGQASVSHHPPPPHHHDRRRFQRSGLRHHLVVPREPRTLSGCWLSIAATGPSRT